MKEEKKAKGGNNDRYRREQTNNKGKSNCINTKKERKCSLVL